MKRVLSSIAGFFRWLTRQTRHVETAQAHTEVWSNRLGWAALVLAIVAGILVFGLTMCLALLPYITVTHTLVAGSILAVITTCLVYFFASKPANALGTASQTLSLTRLGMRIGQRLAPKQEQKPTRCACSGQKGADTNHACPAQKSSDRSKPQGRDVEGNT